MSSPAQTRRHSTGRSTAAPVAVAVVAAGIAGAVWLGTSGGDDPDSDAARPASTATTAPPAPATPQAPATEDQAPATEDPAPTPEAGGDAPQVAQPGEPMMVGDAEITPPPAGQISFPTGDEESWLAPLEERGADGPYALGEVDAPVVMLMYSEFQCPFCRSFAVETMPELMPYVEDGTLRVQWRDFPYLGPESSLAALGGRAAAEQDMFWEYHDAVYALDASPNTGVFTEESLADLAESAGLDGAAFESALNTQEQQEAIADDQEEGIAMGVMGTPAFMVNGVPIRGAQPAPLFVQAIEEAADARGQG